MIHSEVSKAIIEDAPDGTGWAEPAGPARLENHRRNLWHKQSPSHVPVPAQPSAGPDPVPSPVPSPTAEPPSTAQPWWPRAPQPRAGSREGCWLSLQFLWKWLHGIKHILFSGVIFPSGKRQRGIRLNFVSVSENITLLCVPSNLRFRDNSAESYYYYDRRHFYF